MKHILCLLFLIGLFFSLPSAQSKDAGAQKIAEQNYRAFLEECIDDIARKRWNLNAEDNAESAELGTPLPLMQLSPDTILNYKSEGKLESLVSFSNTYLYPVMFNGVIKLIMTVDKFADNDTYEIGSVGHIHLAGEIQNILKHWPQKQGYTPILCMNYQTQTYAFSIPQLDFVNLTVIDPHNTDINRYRRVTAIDHAMLAFRHELDTYLERGMSNE